MKAFYGKNAIEERNEFARKHKIIADNPFPRDSTSDRSEIIYSWYEEKD
jgi:hypothetical protein